MGSKIYGREPVVDALKSAMLARVPSIVIGAPGVGKTATIQALADEIGYELITLLGSSMDPTDLAGLPSPATIEIETDSGELQETRVTDYLTPWWAAKALTKKKVIIFLDEFNNASPAVQASMLTFIQDRTLGNGQKLPKETIIIGAMNPISSAVNGTELALPTTNRIIFLPWHTSSDSWFEGMLDGWGNKISKEEAEWKKKIVAFIRTQPGLLHREPDPNINPEVYGISGSDEMSIEIARMAWPSRRSWDNLSKALAKAPSSPYVQDLIAQGTVGASAAQDFRIWLQSNSSALTPEEVLADPKAVDWENISLNDSAMVFRGIIELIGPSNVGQVLKTVNEVINSNNAGLVGPYYQEIFKKVSDPRLVGEATAAKALKAVQQLLTKLTPYLNS